MGDSKLTYFGIMLAIGGCGNVLFLILPDPGEKPREESTDLRKLVKLGTSR